MLNEQVCLRCVQRMVVKYIATKKKLATDEYISEVQAAESYERRCKRDWLDKYRDSIYCWKVHDYIKKAGKAPQNCPYILEQVVLENVNA
jgi:hypothetical protein